MTDNPSWRQSPDSRDSAQQIAEQAKGIVRDDHGRMVDAETGKLIATDPKRTPNPIRRTP